jgi:autophagy-related protein 2
VRIVADYLPKRLDTAALLAGHHEELLNFVPLDRLTVTLDPADVGGCTGWPSAVVALGEQYAPQVMRQKLNMLAGIAPVRPVVQLGKRMVDVVLLPLEEYRRGRGDAEVTRVLQRCAVDLVRTAAVEGMGVGAQVAGAGQRLLQTVADSAGARGQPSHGAAGRGEPLNLAEGVSSAAASVSRGLSRAATTMFAIPIETYQRTGAGDAVRAVIRAVPIAILEPAIGIAGGASSLMKGGKNALDRGGMQRDRYKR